uniref:hypothetical protein n=1 Tax=Neorhizobium sp. EC2-8 TaxID=3129230 RepID=UPI0031016DE1
MGRRFDLVQGSISKKIVPWTLDWLACYEDWLLSGIWHGGGQHDTEAIGMTLNLEQTR